MVRGILAGVRDPHQLAAHHRRGCTASEPELAAALTGNYRDEHLFALLQNFEGFEFYLRQIADCHQAIEAQLVKLAQTRQLPAQALPAAKPQPKPSKNEPRVELRAPLHRIIGGADLSQIDGIGPYGALQLIAEIGTNMSRWRTAQHFTGMAGAGPQQQNLRQASAQFQAPTLRQPRGGGTALRRDEPQPQ